MAVGKLSFIANLAPEASATPLNGGELAIYVAVDGRYAGAWELPALGVVPPRTLS